jgi:AcrR family transcriptional regulator
VSVRAVTTRRTILATAERLFAEHGIAAVSNRQISEAAGQGNNTAVGYHFGTKADLLRAIVNEHSGEIAAIRERLLTTRGDSTDVRDWVVVTVRPFTEHLDRLGGQTWYARLNAQLLTDPALRRIAVSDARQAPANVAAALLLERCLGDLPADVRTDRSEMARAILYHTCAERERALAAAEPVRHTTWDAAADSLVDAIAGLMLAPVTRATS